MMRIAHALTASHAKRTLKGFITVQANAVLKTYGTARQKQNALLIMVTGAERGVMPTNAQPVVQACRGIATLKRTAVMLEQTGATHGAATIPAQPVVQMNYGIVIQRSPARVLAVIIALTRGVAGASHGLAEQ